MHIEDVYICEKPDYITYEQITELYHKAYFEWKEQGIGFAAANQSIEDTKKRLNNGYCIVALLNGELLGSITMTVENDNHIKILPNPYLHLQQLAINPNNQKGGIGRQLMEYAEEVARREKCSAIVLDTAKPAKRLINWYMRLGYRKMGYIKWANVNYYSIEFYKPINQKIRYARLRYLYQHLRCSLKLKK